MCELDNQGKALLSVLARKIVDIEPGNPEQYVTYLEANQLLGLQQHGPTWGVSLQNQGLTSLNNWTVAKGKPAIAGIIVARETRMPGPGFFRSYQRTPDDFSWWTDQVQRAKDYDWGPYL